MKIESAQIAMQSTHTAFERNAMSLRVERWEAPRMERPPATGTEPSVVEATSDEALTDDPRLAVLIAVIERMLGRGVRLLRMADFEPASTLTYAPPRTPITTGGGSGMSLSLRAERTEYQYVGFAASGVVRTADGREIRFELAFEMERRFVERIELDVQTGAPRQLKDPLVLDFAGSNARLADARFAFDLDADGSDDEIPLPMGGRGFLAFDRNGNGRIDDGRELFGPTSGNGFAELAALDADGNGWIDEADPAFTQLRLWQPDPDGGGTLTSLTEAGVGALFLGNVATPFSLRGGADTELGVMRASGVYLGEDGTVGSISQIDLRI